MEPVSKCVKRGNGHPVLKLFVAVAGTLVLLAGIALLILPGPAFLVIPAGLAILATQFDWAHRLLHRCREYVDKKRKRASSSPGS